MDTHNVKTATLLQRKKKSVQIGKNEILLILRSYVAHPTKWGNILDSIRQNMDQLPPDARALYQNGNLKQLRDRMSGKLGKLMADRNIEDREIRVAVQQVKDMETRLIRRPAQTNADEQPNAEVEEEDARDGIAHQLSDSDAQSDADPAIDVAPVLPVRAENPGPANVVGRPGEDGQARRPKKRPLAELIRDNQQRYNRFIRKKIPKLMRQLGVSSDSSDSN